MKTFSVILGNLNNILDSELSGICIGYTIMCFDCFYLICEHFFV